MGARAHLDIRPEDVTAIVDSREQLPFELTMLKSERGTLPTGDYSVKGLEHEIVVERKSLSDLVNCIGKGRDRFEREIQRMLAYKSKLVVVEEPFEALHAGEWFSMVKPNAAIGTVIGWQALGLPFYFARDRDDAAYFTSRFLFVAARRRWREIQSFIPNLRIAGGL